MLRYAIVIDEQTKKCDVANYDVYDDEQREYFESLGMTEQDVELGYDDVWYLTGYAPQKPLEKLKAEKRKERNVVLEETDKFMLPDFPITEEEKAKLVNYRQYLRDLPTNENFPNVELLTFEKWKGA